MGKQVYRAHRAMAGVAHGELFEADEDDPRVLSGLASKVEEDVPDEVRAALAQPEPPTAAPTAAPGGSQAPPTAQQV